MAKSRVPALFEHALELPLRLGRGVRRVRHHERGHAHVALAVDGGVLRLCERSHAMHRPA